MGAIVGKFKDFCVVEEDSCGTWACQVERCVRGHRDDVEVGTEEVWRDFVVLATDSGLIRRIECGSIALGPDELLTKMRRSWSMQRGRVVRWI